MLSEKPFGFNCTSGMDEQSISYYYSLYKNGPKKNWINLGPSYAFLEWKYKELKVKPPIPDKDVKVIDFVGSEKPWMVEKNKYPDQHTINRIASKIGLTSKQVQKWFLNRRHKLKVKQKL